MPMCNDQRVKKLVATCAAVHRQRSLPLCPFRKSMNTLIGIRLIDRLVSFIFCIKTEHFSMVTGFKIQLKGI